MGLTDLVLWRQRRRLARLRARPAELQADLLRRLVDHHRSTPLGRAFGLDRVRTPADFAARVPLRGYDEHRPHLPRPRYWSLTTGTTSAQKEVPVTRELLRANASAVQLLLASVMLERRSLATVLGKVFFLGACTPLRAGPDGVLRGAATTIGLRERPRFFRQRLLPGDALDELPTWAEKLDALVDLARGQDVRAAFGMPPWLLSFRDHAARRLGIDSLRELWPDLGLVVTGGTFVEPYLERLRAGFGAPTFRSMYSASEGFFGIQDTDAPGYLPLADSIYLELVPVAEVDSPSPTRLRLDQVETGVDYALVLSSWAGLFAYPVGDTVRFTSTSPPRMVVSGRVRRWANVAGEKVGLAQVEAALARVPGLGEAALVALPPDATSPARHVWIVEGRAEETALAAALDRALAAESPTYRVRREGETPALGAPEARVVAPGSFHAWLTRSGRVGAHHKVPRILDEVPADLGTDVAAQRAAPREREGVTA
jgi:acyl-CoA synthetase (AMP-forming)/AMP-acid ligase II